MTEFIEQQYGEGSALCPMGNGSVPSGYSPQVDRHRAWVEVQNEVYDRHPRDTDGELVDITDEQYAAEITALAEERLGAALVPHKSEYMNLYRVTAGSSYTARGRGQVFRSSFLQCPVCLFILPGALS